MELSTLLTGLFGLNLIMLMFLMGLLYLHFKPTRDLQTEVEAALSKSWLMLGLDDKIGYIAAYAQDIRNDYRAFEQILRVPTARGSLGEMGLELILADQLPPTMYDIRKRLPNGLIPDAVIRSNVGLICIDSKFPLDNYREMLHASHERAETRFKRAFLSDLRRHLDKVAQDYVRPDEKTAAFAFVYIPAEGVYWFVTTNALDLLREFTKKGVQLVSPLTLSHKVELIKAGVFDRHLTDEAQQIKQTLASLGRRFDNIEAEWRILRQTHLGNLSRKADMLDKAYQQLRQEFDELADLSTYQGD